MSTQTVDRFASIDDTNFDVYEIRGRLFDTLNAIDPLLWIDLMNCDRLRGCPSYAAELLALDYTRAIERNRPQTAEVLARFYHNEVRPFLNGYYLGMFDPQFPAKEEAKPVLTIVPAIVEREYVDLEFVTTTEHDDDPDTSWLEQTDDQMGDGYEEHAQERVSGYQRGDWHMIGVVVEATLTDDEGRTEEFRQSVWGIESDADQSYINEVAQDLTHELISELNRFGIEDDFIRQFTDIYIAGGNEEVLTLAAD